MGPLTQSTSPQRDQSIPGNQTYYSPQSALPDLGLEVDTAMPRFTTTSVEEAWKITGGGKRLRELAAYLESVNGLSPGVAGKVVASEGESLATVRRRLGDAVRISGRDIEVVRTDDAIYFWLSGRRRRGRPKNSQA